jgi:hypothetical protein
LLPVEKIEGDVVEAQFLTADLAPTQNAIVPDDDPISILTAISLDI